MGKKTSGSKRATRKSPTVSPESRQTKAELVAETRKLRRRIFFLEKERDSQPEESLAILRASQGHLKALLESTDDYILLCDREGKPVFFNSAYAGIMKKVLGIEMKPGLQPHKLLPDPEEVKWWDGLHARVLSGERFRVDYSLPMDGGEIHHLELSYGPVRQGARVTGFCEITRDITKRKRAEMALEERDFWLAQSQRVARIGTYSLDIPQNTWRSTETLDQILGIDPDYARTVDGWAALLHPEDRDWVVDRHNERLHEKRDYHGIYRVIRHADGSIRWVEDFGKFLLDKAGTPVKLVGCIQDITERKNVEEALCKREELYRSLVETTSVVQWEANLETGRFSYIAPQVVALLGYPVDSYTNHESWVNRVHPDDRQAAKETLLAAIGTGEGREMELRMVCADGRTIWVRNVMKVFREEGRPAKLRGFLFDVTTHKEMEQEINRNLNLQSLGTLAAGIAHDFNNLLTAVFGNMELAQRFIDEDSKAHGLLSEAARASGRARHLTRQLLAFARGGVPKTDTVSVRALLFDTATFVLSGSNVECVFNIADDLWTADLDVGQFDQVIHNLTRNAREAMPDGGTVRISARNLQAGVEPSLPLSELDRIEIAVSDSGSGIRPEHLERVFDPYFTTKGFGEDRGTGLGLSICYTVVKKHGGTITVNSVLGQGTTFTLFIPASRSQALPGDSAQPVTANDKSMARGRILVMDDDPAIRGVMAGMLEHLGYEGFYAKDGREAEAFYTEARRRGKPFHAVILDLTIRGGMGGAQTLERLKEVDSAVRAIVATGYANDATVLNYRGKGFLGALVKPFVLEDVKTVLHKVLTGRLLDDQL